jgi:predicted transcriptional regulator
MEIKLTDREAELMEVLWQQGPSTVAEARDGLDDALAYTTVLTMLRTLEAKGYVRHSAEGKAHRYEAVVARDVAQRSALRSLARKLFKGSTELLVTHLVADEKLTDAEIKRLKSLLDERAQGSKRR